ncbi:MAG: hypothetical protein IPG53_23640 [Ignavibacteriales bacterium]|nr:hypothetical protein [Ignavibacteriales bacterium]
MTEKKSRIWVWWVIAKVLTLRNGVLPKRHRTDIRQKINFTLMEQNIKLNCQDHMVTTVTPCGAANSIQNYSATLVYRRFQFDKDYTEVPFQMSDSTLTCITPQTTTCGKLEYSIVVKNKSGETTQITGHETVVIRFKGHVPLWIVLIHVFFMFAGMLTFESYRILRISQT